MFNEQLRKEDFVSYSMRVNLIAGFLLFAACGCGTSNQDKVGSGESRQILTQDAPASGQKQEPSSELNPGMQRQAKQQNQSDGPTPIGSPIAGGLTPMEGTDSVQGAGGAGIGAAAKDRAKSAAGRAGSSSLDQAGD